MIRAAYVTGRILAALGAVLIVAVLTFTAMSIASRDECSEPDCDDVAFDEALETAFFLLPLSIIVGAAGVALVNDTYRKV